VDAHDIDGEVREFYITRGSGWYCKCRGQPTVGLVVSKINKIYIICM
jgi:hypothetical protein